MRSFIERFRIQTASKEDYAAYHRIEADLQTTAFRNHFVKYAGYNPSSPSGNRQQCEVCGKSGPECIGHPQVMKLGFLFISEFGLKTVSNLVSITCVVCKSVIQDTKGEVKDFKGLLKLPRNRRKCNCSNSSPTIIQFKEEKIEASEQEYEWRDGRKKKKRAVSLNLTEDAEKILKLIKESDYTSLDLNIELVKNLFYSKIFLLPTLVHPMRFSRGSTNGVDEFTAYIKEYSVLGSYVAKSLKDEIAKVMRMLSVGSESKKFGDVPSYLTTANGKEGIFRDSSQAKRILNTGRAVLTFGTKRTCELQVPESIANNLHYQYKVSIHNIEPLQKKVGIEVTHIVRDRQSPTNLHKFYEKLTVRSKLKIGDIVLKRLEEGDIGTFSRHPVLWGHSLIAYRMVPWENYCIGLPECNTQGHNADFDGDEGNIQIGSGLESRIEMQMFDSWYKLFGSHSGEPVIKIIYNGIVGAYVISDDVEEMDEVTFRFLLGIINGDKMSQYMGCPQVDESYYEMQASKNRIPYMCGKILFSMLLPKNLTYKKGNINIRDGILLSGRLKSEDINKIIIAIALIDRWMAPYFFVDRGYALLSEYISRKGITISANDYIMLGKDSAEIFPSDYKEKFASVEKKVMELEKLKTQQTSASAERTEELIVLTITQIQEDLEKLFKEGEYRKRGISIISYCSGARGNLASIISGVSSVGQMFSGPFRLGSNVSRLSYYSKPNSNAISDKGYIRNSFAEGLDPHEVYTLAGPAFMSAFMTYRGTPKSGHASRQIIVAMSPIGLSSSLSVVTRKGIILESLYGYGCDPSMISLREISNGDKFESAVDPLQILQLVNSS